MGEEERSTPETATETEESNLRLITVLATMVVLLALSEAVSVGSLFSALAFIFDRIHSFANGPLVGFFSLLALIIYALSQWVPLQGERD